MERKQLHDREEKERKELLEWLEDDVKGLVLREALEDRRPIVVSKEDEDSLETMEATKKSCNVERND